MSLGTSSYKEESVFDITIAIMSIECNKIRISISAMSFDYKFDCFDRNSFVSHVVIALYLYATNDFTA